MRKQKFSTSYILEKVHLTWTEVLWGYEHKLLNFLSVVEIAVNSLIDGSDNPLVIELAGLTNQESWRMEEILKELSDKISSGTNSNEYKKWLYLTLDWVYTNLDSFIDPLSEIEEVYADFNYPQEMEQFIRYMPAQNGYDPSKYTQEENEKRLYQK
ncbi:MAG: DUF2247 family protein, partial [Dolichospermum sp.]